MNMDTKLKADIAESAVITELLKRRLIVLKPYGDRLSYDVAVDQGAKLIRIQVKSAWIDKIHRRYVIDARQTKTNRRKMVRKYYGDNDFDFAIVYVQDFNDFFVIPISIFKKFKGTITLIESDGKEAKTGKISVKKFRNRWDLLMGSLASNG